MATEIEVLSDYIRREFAYEGELDPNGDLLDAKILDSFSIVQLAVFIQQQFEVELDANDLVRENLSTLTNMVNLIAKRKA
jgi:acyl carrier protein